MLIKPVLRLRLQDLIFRGTADVPLRRRGAWRLRVSQAGSDAVGGRFHCDSRFTRVAVNGTSA